MRQISRFMLNMEDHGSGSDVVNVSPPERALEGMHERAFLVDPEGHKTAVVLPIEDFRALVERLEELEDFRLIEERKSEPRIDVSTLEELLAAVEAPDQPERP